MSEEQPNFKVTDRRLFNADGSPRDLAPEERSETKTAAPEAPPPPATPVAAPNPSTEPETNLQGGVEAADNEEEELTEEDIAADRDPASFVNFMMSIASNAAASLGMMEHPVTHQREVDVELGKHWIDVLGMLQNKTNGNLTAQEKQVLDGLLSDLRMQYVSLVNASQKPRAFSGKDITGGR